MSFEGWGHSKRDARASAARACLEALLARAGRVLPPPAQPQDFTSDEIPPFVPSEFQCLETKIQPASIPKPPTVTKPATPPPAPPGACPATSLFGASAVLSATKSPINMLYESYPGVSFVCTFGDGSPLDGPQVPQQLNHSMRFKVVCQIKDQKFDGYGSSKKLAKVAAARAALAVLEEGRTSPTPRAAPAGFLSQTLADHIGKLVNEKFNELMANDLVHSKRKVLAGIVITIDNRIEGAKVIAVTTGTKCVSGEHMSVRGRAVNDCHAEVAARRCLQRHLYAQLLLYASSSDPTIPIPSSDVEPVPGGGYQVKPSRQVHLYVSTAPCGDGRIFSPHEHDEPEPDRHPNRLARGQLRTKIESGEGTIPVKNSSSVVQTWDGVMQGERLLTMSCSDKVARWCVVGVQGSLLSKLLRPVYLHSLVLGSLLHPHHMYRAICGRIENYIASLPPPFRLHRPMLARAASVEARTPARAPSFSVCWCTTTQSVEVVNATTGKLESGQPSLLCKQSMFARWQYLTKRLPQLQELDDDMRPVVMPANIENLLYSEAKQLCPTYQCAKDRLIDAFEKAKLGRWIKKPIEQDQFLCEIENAAPNVLFAWTGRDLCDSAMQRDNHINHLDNDPNKFNENDSANLVINNEADSISGSVSEVDIKDRNLSVLTDRSNVVVNRSEHASDNNSKLNKVGSEVGKENDLNSLVDNLTRLCVSKIDGSIDFNKYDNDKIHNDLDDTKCKQINNKCQNSEKEMNDDKIFKLSVTERLKRLKASAPTTVLYNNESDDCNVAKESFNVIDNDKKKSDKYVNIKNIYDKINSNLLLTKLRMYDKLKKKL